MKNFSAVMLSAIAVLFAVPQVVSTARDGHFALCFLFVVILLGAMAFGFSVKGDIDDDEQQNTYPNIFS